MEVDHVNRLGWTALHEAIILGDGSQRYVDTVRELVAGRADVELAPCGDNVSPTAHGQSHGVCRSGHHPRGGIGPVHEPSHSEAEAGRRLLTAAESGDADAVALALRAGAPIEQRDEQGRTALLLAATFDRVEVARALEGPRCSTPRPPVCGRWPTGPDWTSVTWPSYTSWKASRLRLP